MKNEQRYNGSAVVLWASAFVIAAMVIVQAGRLPGNTAQADVVAARGGYTLLTTDSGRGPDENPYQLLYVLDSIDEVLLVYEIVDSRTEQILLRDGGSLVNLIRSARP